MKNKLRERVRASLGSTTRQALIGATAQQCTALRVRPALAAPFAAPDPPGLHWRKKTADEKLGACVKQA